MPSKIELLEAEIEVARLEEKLVAAKSTDEGPDLDLKLELRAARQKFRELRGSPPAGPGDGVAEPATLEAKAGVQ